jgi:predicted HicB family RNase H-like nuclease
MGGVLRTNPRSGRFDRLRCLVVGRLAPTPVEALAGLADVVRDVLTALAASGEPIPEPLSERTYSGRFVVRVPAEVHRRLVRDAAEQHVSLNRLVSDRLARA